ncbi:DUF7528 family protein [Natronosalvus vescus]|uniref:DUF7528 family protein n=1 Tax=Natronosalvus vescus TaxID=2953881 RepID=UPI0020901799|nr:hypothetical protein [Natronosalvus vescus]
MTTGDVSRLRNQLTEALERTEEFTHTTATRRGDGTYVVARRGATSSGHRKVFDSFEAVKQLYQELPSTFTVSDVDYDGVTGSRRHILLWHLLEHPAFACKLVQRQPLTGRKTALDSSLAPPHEHE